MSIAIFVQRTFFSYLAKLVPTVFALVTTFVVARILGPADYGLFTFITALFGGFFLVFAGGMLTNSAFVFTAKYESKKLYEYILLAAHVVALLIASAFLLIPELKSVTGVESDKLLFFGIVYLFFTPFGSILTAVFKGFNRFGVVFKSTLTENSANLALSVVTLYYLSWGLDGIFIAKFFSMLVGVMVYLFEYRKLAFSAREVSVKEVLSFIGWNSVGDAFRQGTNQIITIFVGLFLSPAVLGTYYLSQKIASATVGIPSAAASEVLLSHSAKQTDSVTMWRDMFRVTRVTFLLTCLFGFVLLFLLPFFVTNVFPQFEGADRLLGLFIAYSISTTLTFPANIFRTNNWMKILAIFQLLGLLIAISTGYFLGTSWGAEGLIISQLLVNVIVGFSLMGWIIRTQRIPFTVVWFQKGDVTLFIKWFERWTQDAARTVRNR